MYPNGDKVKDQSMMQSSEKLIKALDKMAQRMLPLVSINKN